MKSQNTPRRSAKDGEKGVRYESELFQQGFVMVPNVLLFMDELSAGALRLWAALAYFARESEECWPGQTKLAGMLGVSERAIRGHLRELEEHGLVKTRQRGLGKPNLYRLVVPDRKKTSGLDRKETSDKVDAVEVDTKNNTCRTSKKQKSDVRSPSSRGKPALKKEAPLTHLLNAELEKTVGGPPRRIRACEAKQEWRMLEQDGRDPEEAAELIRFAVEDSDHWQIVLASEANPMAKFRGAYNAIASSGGAVYA